MFHPCVRQWSKYSSLSYFPKRHIIVSFFCLVFVYQMRLWLWEDKETNDLLHHPLSPPISISSVIAMCGVFLIHKCSSIIRDEANEPKAAERPTNIPFLLTWWPDKTLQNYKQAVQSVGFSLLTMMMAKWANER